MRGGISRHLKSTADGFTSEVAGFCWIYLGLEKASFWGLETRRLRMVNLLKLELELESRKKDEIP
jgi:hypothetical protein